MQGRWSSRQLGDGSHIHGSEVVAGGSALPLLRKLGFEVRIRLLGGQPSSNVTLAKMKASPLFMKVMMSFSPWRYFLCENFISFIKMKDPMGFNVSVDCRRCRHPLPSEYQVILMEYQ